LGAQSTSAEKRQKKHPFPAKRVPRAADRKGIPLKKTGGVACDKDQAPPKKGEDSDDPVKKRRQLTGTTSQHTLNLSKEVK